MRELKLACSEGPLARQILFALALFAVFPIALVSCPEAMAIELGEEYSDHSKSSGPAKKIERSWLYAGLVYLPNRLLDLLDVFRVDAGVGPSFGAVLRLSKWGQVGYRDMQPLSVRVGLRGRRMPIFIERSAEFGFGPTFLASSEREISPMEVGAGADLLLVGGYFGLSIDEMVDFFAGIVGFDPGDDDI